jgi:small subunit ribosomal protein S1
MKSKKHHHHLPIERPEDDADEGASRGTQDFAAMLAAFEQGHTASTNRPKVGDKVSARIVSLGEESAFVDLGGKAEGVIPLLELSGEDGVPTAGVGDTVEGTVVSTEDDVIVLRVRGGRSGPLVPAELAQAHAHHLPVEGTVQAVVKGGVEVTVSGIRAFCPISQLDNRFVEDANAFVGQRLAFRITRYEEGRGRGPNIVLSRRALLEEEAQRQAAVTRAHLAVGKVVRGKVTSVTSYGAFVDLGGLEGMIHVSQLGHSRLAHAQEAVAVGQELEVQVLRIEPTADGKERIALSRRALLKDTWHDTAAELTTGSRRPGKVVRLEPFGAFVELAPGVDGLLHLSELSAAGPREVKHPREVLAVGQTLEVSVLAVDHERRRISLTLARRAEEAENAAGHTPGTSGSFGAFGDFLAQSQKKG